LKNCETARFAQGAKFAKENILESREKAAFQKIVTLSRETNITPQSVKPFGLRISPAKEKNSSWRSPCPDPALTCSQGNTSRRYLLQGECRGAVHFS
jgi:hypothetical protein